MSNRGIVVQFSAGSKGLSLLQSVQPGSGASSKEAREFLLEVNQFGLETDHIRPSSTEVKNEWSYTATR
jgi:hypothetical protein